MQNYDELTRAELLRKLKATLAPGVGETRDGRNPTKRIPYGMFNVSRAFRNGTTLFLNWKDEDNLLAVLVSAGSRDAQATDDELRAILITYEIPIDAAETETEATLPYRMGHQPSWNTSPPMVH